MRPYSSSDRIVMMTNGPEAEVGDILPIHFPRPRDRRAVLEHSDYYLMREHLLTFLHERAHLRVGPRPTPPQPVPRADLPRPNAAATPESRKTGANSDGAPSASVAAVRHGGGPW